jgi:hypothetical protein
MSLSKDYDITQYSDDDDQGGGPAPANDQVGYAKPPRAKQFKKGTSGNPRGRPKGSGMRDAVDKVLGRKVAVTVDGQRLMVPLTEALLMQAAQSALTGNAAARRDVLKIAGQEEEAKSKDVDAAPWKVIVNEFGQPEGCDGALEVLQVLTNIAGQYKISPWVVEAALARGVRLDAEDRELVDQFTVTPGDVPRGRDRD